MASNCVDTSKMPKYLMDCSDWDMKTIQVSTLARLNREIHTLLKNPIPEIFIARDSNDITKFHALIIGPSNTPYQGGFFYFILRCPPNYPVRAPRCQLMTTGNQTVQFHPYIDSTGKIFLSIIDTWSKPAWCPAQCISSVFLSIQSILSQNPYQDEPGYEQERQVGDSEKYNELILHETLRVAVCEMLENQNSCPQVLRDIMINQFFKFYDYYVFECTQNMDNDDQLMRDPFSRRCGSYQYSSIFTRLEQLKSSLEITEPPTNVQLLIAADFQTNTESRNNGGWNEFPHVDLCCGDTDDDSVVDQDDDGNKKTEEDY